MHIIANIITHIARPLPLDDVLRPSSEAPIVANTTQTYTYLGASLFNEILGLEHLICDHMLLPTSENNPFIVAHAVVGRTVTQPRATTVSRHATNNLLQLCMAVPTAGLQEFWE